MKHFQAEKVTQHSDSTVLDYNGERYLQYGGSLQMWNGLRDMCRACTNTEKVLQMMIATGTRSESTWNGV